MSKQPPVNQLLDIMAAKWTTEVLHELSIGPTRTRKFLAVIPGLTMKSLRQRLVELEDHGFVVRHQLSTRPPKVQYEITARGRKLVELITQVKKVADELEVDAPAAQSTRQRDLEPAFDSGDRSSYSLLQAVNN